MFCEWKIEAKLSGKMPVYCASCEKYAACAVELGFPVRITEKRNVIENSFPDGSSEVIFHRRPFMVPALVANQPKKEGGRNWMTIVDDGRKVWVPKKKRVTYAAALKTFRAAQNRALDQLYGICLSNNWEYFITVTFSAKEVDRHDDDIVKTKWSEWLRSVRKKSPDLQCFVVPERHKDGAIHFHGFMSNANVTLVEAHYPENFKIVSKRGKPIYSKLGDPIFNIKEWTYGFSTVAVLPQEGNYERVVNYVSKYISKEGGTVGYNKKRYYRTRNLLKKQKVSYNLKLEDGDLDPVKIDGVAVTPELAHFLIRGYEVKKVMKKGEKSKYMTKEKQLSIHDVERSDVVVLKKRKP